MTKNIEIKECKTNDEIAATLPLMQQLPILRCDVLEMTPEEYTSRVREVMEDGYRLICAKDKNDIVGIAGFRTKKTLHNGNAAYLDELVVDEKQRSEGIGKALLDWVEAEARKHNCRMIELECGTYRQEAHKFYFREGFTIQSFDFWKKLD